MSQPQPGKMFEARDYEKVKALTDEHMKNPQVGDVFEEMLSYWVHVVARLGSHVVFQELSGAGNGALQIVPVAEFAPRWAYKSIPGYSVLYHGNIGERVMDFVP